MKGQPAVRTSLVVVRAVLIAAIVITLFVAYGLIDNAWYRVLAVRGGSMEPTITAGDMIVITRPPDQIEEGMVLTLQVDGAVVTHRVIEVRPDGTFVTQGDANDSHDDFTANDVRIVGVYRFSIPVVGSVIDWLTSSGAWVTGGDTAGGNAIAGSWASDLDPVPIMVDGPLLIWGPSGTPVPTPTPSADSPSPSPSPTGSATPIGAQTPSPSEAATPDPTTSAAPSPDPSPTDESTPEPEPTPTPSPSPRSTLDPVP